MKDLERSEYLERQNKNINLKMSEILLEIARLQDALLLIKEAKARVVREWAELNPPANFIGGETKEEES